MRAALLQLADFQLGVGPVNLTAEEAADPGLQGQLVRARVERDTYREDLRGLGPTTSEQWRTEPSRCARPHGPFAVQGESVDDVREPSLEMLVNLMCRLEPEAQGLDHGLSEVL